MILENPVHRLLSLHVKHGKFKTSAQKETDTYVDVKEAMTDPKGLETLSNAIVWASVPIEHHRLAAIELGSVPVVACASLMTMQPWILVRKQRDHGIEDTIVASGSNGYPKADIGAFKVLIIEDVTTTGNSLLRGVLELRKRGAIVEDALTILDREEGADKLLEENGVRLHALAYLSDIE